MLVKAGKGIRGREVERESEDFQDVWIGNQVKLRALTCNYWLVYIHEESEAVLRLL